MDDAKSAATLTYILMSRRNVDQILIWLFWSETKVLLLLHLFHNIIQNLGHRNSLLDNMYIHIGGSVDCIGKGKKVVHRYLIYWTACNVPNVLYSDST